MELESSLGACRIEGRRLELTGCRVESFTCMHEWEGGRWRVDVQIHV